MKLTLVTILKGWFGLTRSERRATTIILFITLAVGLVRYAVPAGRVQAEQLPLPDAIKESRFAAPPERPEYIRTTSSNQRKIAVKVELNSCDSAALEALPGFGPVLSARIIKYRNLLGGYYTVEQLREVYGMSPENFGLAKDFLTADTSLLRKIAVNRAEYRDLLRFPYFEKHNVAAILKFRELQGTVTRTEDLLLNNILDSALFYRVRVYLSCD
jgi:DNA uptake protein ComE-like DNA-binding protein